MLLSFEVVRKLDSFIFLYNIPVCFSFSFVVFVCPWITIEDGWENRWVKSDWKKDENLVGEWNHTSGAWNGDRNDKGTPLTLPNYFIT